MVCALNTVTVDVLITQLSLNIVHSNLRRKQTFKTLLPRARVFKLRTEGHMRPAPLFNPARLNVVSWLQVQQGCGIFWALGISYIYIKPMLSSTARHKWLRRIVAKIE